MKALNIAGINFLYISPQGEVLADPTSSYDAFSSSAAEAGEPIPVTVKLQDGDLPLDAAGEKIFEGGSAWILSRRETDYNLELKSQPEENAALARITFDSQVTTVAIECGKSMQTLRDGRSAVENPLRYPVDQIILMYLLALRGGAIIHAAGVKIKGGGFIFPGVSGAGKSTLSRILAAHPDVTILSDDRMIVRQKEKGFQAYGTPWPGDFGAALNIGIELKGIFFIHHAPEYRIEKITPQRALAELMPVTSIPWFDQAALPNALTFCDKLISGIPAFDLYFHPDEKAAETLIPGIIDACGRL